MHGACFSIIYGKKFVAIKNRSKERFDSLAKLTDYPHFFFEDSTSLLGKENIFTDIDYDSIYKRIELKRMESERWLDLALNAEIKPKSGNDATEVMLQLLKSLHGKTELLNKIMTNYAYEEDQKEEINAKIKAGKTWFDIVSSRNNTVPKNIRLREVNTLQEYFSILRADSKYVIILSGRDECATYRGKFLEASGLALRKDVQWRDSYVAVIDEGVVKIDEVSKEEINTFVSSVRWHFSHFSLCY